MLEEHHAAVDTDTWQGCFENPSVLFCSFLDFAIRTISMDTVESRVFYVFESRQIKMCSFNEPYIKLLTYLAC